jgi:hypothetical protein
MGKVIEDVKVEKIFLKELGGLEEDIRDLRGDNIVVIKALAFDLGLTTHQLRKKLRFSGFKKHGGRWEWLEDDKELEKIRAIKTDRFKKKVEIEGRKFTNVVKVGKE